MLNILYMRTYIAYHLLHMVIYHILRLHTAFSPFVVAIIAFLLVGLIMYLWKKFSSNK